MLRQLGKSSFFFSLSAAETKWGFLLKTLKKNVDGEEISEEDALNLTWFDKCHLIRTDPTTCARHFDNMVRAFLNILCRKGENGILGNVLDFVIRIEFQQVLDHSLISNCELTTFREALPMSTECSGLRMRPFWMKTPMRMWRHLWTCTSPRIAK